MRPHSHSTRAISAFILVLFGLGLGGSRLLWGGATLLHDNYDFGPALFVDENGDARFQRFFPPQMPVTMFINDQGLPGVVNGLDFAILNESLDRWSQVPESTWVWRNGGTVPQTTAALDGINLFTFVDPIFNLLPAGVLGVTFINVADTPSADGPEGRIIDVDIAFSPFYPWDLIDQPGPGEINLKLVAVHELGHALGLSHHPNQGGIMFPVYIPAAVGRDYPFPDDKSILCHMYPNEVPLAQNFGTVRGHVRDEAGQPVWNAWITLVREDGTRNPDGFDSVGAWTMLKGEYVIRRVPPGRYWVQMGPLIPQIRGADTGLGGYGIYGAPFFNLINRFRNVVGSVQVRRDYPVEWFDNQSEAIPNIAPLGATVLDIRPGQVYDPIDFVVGFELPALPDIEPNNTFAEAIPVEYGEVKLGRIDPIPAGVNPDVDFYTWESRAGDFIVIEATAVTPLLAPSPLHPRLTLYDEFFNFISTVDAIGNKATLPLRVQRSGRYYAKLEDSRGIGFGGPDYVYRFEVDLAPTHLFPQFTNLIAPARGPAPSHSEPVAVIGLDLVDNYGDGYGDAYLSKVVVRFSNHSATQRITPEDLIPMGLDYLSGVSLWRDSNGDGGFNYTRGLRIDDDEVILLSDIRVVPDVDGFTVEMYPKLATDGTGSRARLPGSPDGGRADFFVVIRPSDTLQHSEAFSAQIPPGGLTVIDQFTPYVVNPDYAIPELPQTLIGEIVQYVVYTNPQNIDNADFPPSTGYLAHPLEIGRPELIFGLNVWGNKGEGYRITRLHITLRDLLDFEPEDLEFLNNTPESGVSLWVDKPGSVDGVFEVQEDELVRLKFPESRIRRGGDDTGPFYEVILVPEQPLEVPATDLAEHSTVGADYFVVLRCSRRVRDGDLLRVDMRVAETGPVVFSDGDSTRRALDDTTRPYSHMLRISPQPEFIFTSLVKDGDIIGRQSRTRPVIGINAQDFGAHYSLPDPKVRFGWVFDSIRVDFLDTGVPGNFTADDLLPLNDDVFLDAFHQEPISGVALFRDDNTPLFVDAFGTPGFDPDFDGRVGEEYLNNMDDDLDGLTDEDVGDFDPAGIQGQFDEFDDYIPFTLGHLFPTEGPGVANLRAFNRYVTPPQLSQLPTGNGFSATFFMRIVRRELRFCGSDFATGLIYPPVDSRVDVFSDFALAPHGLLAGEAPLFLTGFTNLYSVFTCTNREVTNVGVGINFVVVPHQAGAPDDPCNHQVEPVPGQPPPCTNRVDGRPVVRVTYVHGIEIPDDDFVGGPNHGDDFYVTIRTSPLIANGDDFQVRIAEGGIRYSRYEDVVWHNFTPKSSRNSVTTPLLRADVRIQARMSDQTFEGQMIAPGAVEDDPMETFALNLDMGGDVFGPLPGVSPERLSGFVLELFSPADALPRERIVISNNPAISHLLPIGPGRNSGVLFFQDDPAGRGRDGVLDLAIDPLIDVKADPEITGSGTVNDPYRIKIELNQTVPIYYDDFTGAGQFAAGNDYFIALRASGNMPPGVRFMARLRAQDFSGTTALDPQGESAVITHEIRSNVPVQISSRIESQRELTDANLGPRTLAFALNMRDEGANQKLDSVRVRLIPIQPSRFPQAAGPGFSVRTYTLPGDPPQIQVIMGAIVNAGDGLTISNGVDAPIAVGTGGGVFFLTGDTLVVALTNNSGGSGFVVLDVREAGQPAIPRTAASEFTLSDLAPLNNTRDSGLALYRDVNVGPLSQNAVFDVSDELVAVLPTAAGLDVLLKCVGTLPDVPDTDTGENEGADFYVVFRTSSSISIGDAFALEIPPGGIVFDNLGPSPASRSTAVIWANRRYVPTLEITRPLNRLEPGDPVYTIRWEDSDPDQDNPTIALYYIPENDIGQPTAERTLIVENLPAIPDGIADRYDWQTAGLPRGEYRIIGIIQDNAGNVVEATSPGTVLLAPDVANITFVAPTSQLSEEQRTAVGGLYNIRWSDGDEDPNSRLRLFWDDDLVADDPLGVQMNFISGSLAVSDRENAFLWTLPVEVLERYDRINVGYVQTDPDLDLPIIDYADAPIIIRSVTPSVSVEFALNLSDANTLREALARQEIPVHYRANDIDSNGPNTARVNLYYVDASLIGPATGQVTLALLDQLAQNGQFLVDLSGRLAVDLPEDAANGGLLYTWDISQVPAGTYGIIATCTDRPILSNADLIYATAGAFLTVPPLRFPARFLSERFEQSSALAADLTGDGVAETVLLGRSGRMLAFNRTGMKVVDKHLLPTTDSGQVVSSPAAGDFDRTRPGTELVVGVGGALGPALLYIAAGSNATAATRLISLDVSPLRPGVDATPAVGDLDGDGELDVVIKLRSGKIVALAGDGLGNFSPLWSVDSLPQPTSGQDGSPAIGNVLGDENLEVVVGTADGSVLVIETLPEFRVTNLFTSPRLNNVIPQVVTSPALHDIDGDGYDEIFIGVATNLYGKLYGLNGDATGPDTLSVVTKPGLEPGTVLAISDLPETAPGRSIYPIRVSPAFGDVNGDGVPDLVFASERYLYAYSFRPAERGADLLFAFPGPVGGGASGFTQCSPILADLLVGEGAQEIVIGSDSQLFILTYEGGQVKSSSIMSDPALVARLAFDLAAPGRIATTPLISDAVLDGEGRLDLVLVVASDAGGLVDAINVFNGTLAANRNRSWPMLKGGPSRTARFGETEAKAALPFDLNHDGVLDYRDVILFSLSWAATGGDAATSSVPLREDFDRSGRIDADDLHLLIEVWKKF